jgi:hypothetical protein
MHDEDLARIIEQLRSMEERFEPPTTAAGPHLNSRDRATTKGLLNEAKAILDEGLGFGNGFSMAILSVINAPGLGFFNPPSLEQLQEAIGAAEGGLNQLRRKLSRPSVQPGIGKPAYVSPSRIAELQSIPSAQWDTKRLVRMLQELNEAHARDLHMATSMLVRAISDHVPPIFGAPTFPAVANNISGKSISGSLKHLDTSLRNIADGHLHAQIRQREVLPSPAQVDFRQDLDVLLQEVVRVLRP